MLKTTHFLGEKSFFWHCCFSSLDIIFQIRQNHKLAWWHCQRREFLDSFQLLWFIWYLYSTFHINHLKVAGWGNMKNDPKILLFMVYAIIFSLPFAIASWGIFLLQLYTSTAETPKKVLSMSKSCFDLIPLTMTSDNCPNLGHILGIY